MNTRQDLDRILEQNSHDLLFGGENQSLKQALNGKLGDITKAYVIDWIPEQGCDIYMVVVPPDKVLTVEIAKMPADVDSEPIIEVCGYSEFCAQNRSARRERRDRLEAVARLIAKTA